MNIYGKPAASFIAALMLLAGGCSDGGEKELLPRAGSRPQRIVCASPAVTEIVFALGRGDQVVGVSDFTVYPPEAETIESIGGWANPNRERLLVLEPDIIIMQGKHETLTAFARQYGILTHAVKLDNMEDLYAAIESIAAALDVVERGKELKNDIHRAIRAVADKTPDMPPKRVLLLLGRTPGSLAGLTTAGPGTFLSDIVNTAGGTNVFGDAFGTYPQVSTESLLVRAPEIIMEIHPGGLTDQAIKTLSADWQAFPDIPAVKNGRIHYLTNDYMLIPGPRVKMIAEDFATAIHREAVDE